VRFSYCLLVPFHVERDADDTDVIVAGETSDAIEDR
jgi:hypothetical protein